MRDFILRQLLILDGRTSPSGLASPCAEHSPASNLPELDTHGYMPEVMGLFNSRASRSISSPAAAPEAGNPESDTLCSPSSDGTGWDETHSSHGSSSLYTGSTSGSTSSLSQASGIASNMEIYKRRAVDTVMGEFRSLLSHNPLIGLSIRAGGRESFDQASVALSQSESTSRHSSSTDLNGSSKRSRREADTSPTRNDRENGSEAKKFKQSPSAESLYSPRFACPFYRRNARKHLKHRSCGGPGWNSVHRIKSVYSDNSLAI